MVESSVATMIRRFRESAPSSRMEREADRRAGGIREMWWVDESSHNKSKSDFDVNNGSDEIYFPRAAPIASRQNVSRSALVSNGGLRFSSDSVDIRGGIFDMDLDRDIRRTLIEKDMQNSNSIVSLDGSLRLSRNSDVGTGFRSLLLPELRLDSDKKSVNGDLKDDKTLSNAKDVLANVEELLKTLGEANDKLGHPLHARTITEVAFRLESDMDAFSKLYTERYGDQDAADKLVKKRDEEMKEAGRQEERRKQFSAGFLDDDVKFESRAVASPAAVPSASSESSLREMSREQSAPAPSSSSSSSSISRLGSVAQLGIPGFGPDHGRHAHVAAAAGNPAMSQMTLLNTIVDNEVSAANEKFLQLRALRVDIADRMRVLEGFQKRHAGPFPTAEPNDYSVYHQEGGLRQQSFVQGTNGPYSNSSHAGLQYYSETRRDPIVDMLSVEMDVGRRQGAPSGHYVHGPYAAQPFSASSHAAAYNQQQSSETLLHTTVSSAVKAITCGLDASMQVLSTRLPASPAELEKQEKKGLNVFPTAPQAQSSSPIEESAQSRAAVPITADASAPAAPSPVTATVATNVAVSPASAVEAVQAKAPLVASIASDSGASKSDVKSSKSDVTTNTSASVTVTDPLQTSSSAIREGLLTLDRALGDERRDRDKTTATTGSRVPEASFAQLPRFEPLLRSDLTAGYVPYSAYDPLAQVFAQMRTGHAPPPTPNTPPIGYQGSQGFPSGFPLAPDALPVRVSAQAPVALEELSRDPVQGHLLKPAVVVRASSDAELERAHRLKTGPLLSDRNRANESLSSYAVMNSVASVIGVSAPSAPPLPWYPQSSQGIQTHLPSGWYGSDIYNSNEKIVRDLHRAQREVPVEGSSLLHYRKTLQTRSQRSGKGEESPYASRSNSAPSRDHLVTALRDGADALSIGSTLLSIAERQSQLQSLKSLRGAISATLMRQ